MAVFALRHIIHINICVYVPCCVSIGSHLANINHVVMINITIITLYLYSIIK